MRTGVDHHPSPGLQSGLTCLQQHLSAVQVLHLVAVVLGVRGAGAGGPGLGPVYFGETFGVELQGLHLTLPGQLQHHPAGHHVPAAEHRRAVHLRRVEDDVQLFQLVENHFWTLCKCFKKYFLSSSSFKYSEVGLRTVAVFNISFKTEVVVQFRPYLEAEKGAALRIYYVRPQERIEGCDGAFKGSFSARNSHYWSRKYDQWLHLMA